MIMIKTSNSIILQPYCQKHVHDLQVGYCVAGSYEGALNRLEPYEGKLSRTVLRGGSGGNATSLPDNDNSAQGQAMGVLANKVRKVLLLTGTLMGGYADDLFFLLWRIMPRRMIEDGFRYNLKSGSSILCLRIFVVFSQSGSR